MASASSCKVALRRRSIEIENLLRKDEKVLRFWEEIENRPKFRIEEMFKGKTGREKDREETEGGLFVKSAFIMITVWIALVVLMAIFGQSIQLITK